MFPAPVALLLLAGCNEFDKVPIVYADEEEVCAPSRDVTVACTLDGDTFQVTACGGESVRLLGINAPEIAHSDTEIDECYGPESAAWVTDLLLARELHLTFDAVCFDAFERTLAYAWYFDDDGEEVLLNEQIVANGYARVYEDFDDIRLAERLYAAEADAQAANAGLWSVCE